MKLYERGSLPRVIGLVAALLILVLFVRSLPTGVHIPATADPETLYHTTWEVVGQTFYDQQKLADWASWEHKYDGKLNSQQDAEKAIAEMLASLEDPYTVFLSPKAAAAEVEHRRGSFVGVGIMLAPRVVDGKPVLNAAGEVMPDAGASGLPKVGSVIEGGPAERAGLKAGDELVALTDTQTGKPVRVEAKDLSLPRLAESIRGTRGSQVTFHVIRDGKPLDVTITRDAVVARTVTHRVLDGNIGYIQVRDFGSDQMVPQLIEAVKALKDTRGLIVDLRNNPGGQVNNAIMGASIFLESGHVTVQRIRSNGVFVEVQHSLTADNLVVTAMSGTDTDMEVVKRPFKQQTRLPVVILVNGHSASASEMFAGALQDNGRATVVGVKTFGKGIGQSVIPMPNGTSLHVTSLRYYTPKMRWVGDATGGLFSNGILPDVVVPASKAKGEDNQLDAARARIEALVPRN